MATCLLSPWPQQSGCSHVYPFVAVADSQFVVPGTSEADLTGMVIKTLERLQAEPLPCVSFNPADNTCVYIDDRFQGLCVFSQCLAGA